MAMGRVLRSFVDYFGKVQTQLHIGLMLVPAWYITVIL